MICHRRILRGVWAVFCVGMNLIFGFCAVVLISAYHNYRYHCGWFERQFSICPHGGYGFVEFFLCLSVAMISAGLILLQLCYLWKLIRRQPLPPLIAVAKEFALTALSPLLIAYPAIIGLADAA